ncbi:radical SAM protein [Patescibacteria group bacterium]|nr:radical SAM protein [Patescibacteria group bacterium]
MDDILAWPIGELRRIVRKVLVYIKYRRPPCLSLFPVGWNCNHTCLMCWRNGVAEREKKLYSDTRNPQILQLKDYKRILLATPLRWLDVAVTGGGEPLLYKDIIPLFNFLERLRFNCLLTTNGVLINDQILEVILNYKNTFDCAISVNAASAQTYKIVNGADDFMRVLGVIKEMVKKKREEEGAGKVLFKDRIIDGNPKI